MAVRIETQGAVATVVIDRPERKNAVDARTSQDLTEAFRAVEADEAIGAAVLWGAGETFCAGDDIKGFLDFAPMTDRGTSGCTRRR